MITDIILRNHTFFTIVLCNMCAYRGDMQGWHLSELVCKAIFREQRMYVLTASA